MPQVQRASFGSHAQSVRPSWWLLSLWRIDWWRGLELKPSALMDFSRAIKDVHHVPLDRVFDLRSFLNVDWLRRTRYVVRAECVAVEGHGRVAVNLSHLDGMVFFEGRPLTQQARSADQQDQLRSNHERYDISL